MHRTWKPMMSDKSAIPRSSAINAAVCRVTTMRTSTSCGTPGTSSIFNCKEHSHTERLGAVWERQPWWRSRGTYLRNIVYCSRNQRHCLCIGGLLV